ncbi:hypothetical protein [Pontibacter pudoricolor]|uniref:hypothetical protein n=1 Tax=Pontibacter pudoricolor TaxID=2694930 RepID=UPI0013912333|nr:hypothetical protein [Pontibacter pudoricolor]
MGTLRRGKVYRWIIPEPDTNTAVPAGQGDITPPPSEIIGQAYQLSDMYPSAYRVKQPDIPSAYGTASGEDGAGRIPLTFRVAAYRWAPKYRFKNAAVKQKDRVIMLSYI